MKKILSMVMVIGMLAIASGALASGTNTLTVTATVTGTCKFVSTTSTLNFGALDPSSSSDVNGSGTTTFWCTKGTTQTLSANNGANWDGSKRNMKDSASGDQIPYTLTLAPDGGTNQGPGSPRTLTISGTILNADYVSKTAGSYTDTVTLNITP
ncbi:MAG: hypothetical protein A4E63_02827 [Syntrophorhabdus sp. PtaU1.Bin050]|nr:MAG: hypothetical protein A4E63_02827 [Syntrophorhabdus sp. PtaU1.Bin050]